MRNISFAAALGWIVGSSLLVSGSVFSGWKYYRKWQERQIVDPHNHLLYVIQTGPQKEAIKTSFLAELLNLSVDRPVPFSCFDPKRASSLLLRFPIIKEAHVKKIKPSTVYVDYTVRQPIAWIADYENTAMDREGFLFPVSPFFSPKNLPEIYFGLAPFGLRSEDPERPLAQWGAPIQGKYVELALELFHLLSQSHYQVLFNVRRIDVSNAYADSYGIREIVLLIEDEFLSDHEGRDVLCIAPRLLRLSTKNYIKQLHNYLVLRDKLLEQERKEIVIPEGVKISRSALKVIDLRIPGLAFIDQRAK